MLTSNFPPLRSQYMAIHGIAKRASLYHHFHRQSHRQPQCQFLMLALNANPTASTNVSSVIRQFCCHRLVSWGHYSARRRIPIPRISASGDQCMSEASMLCTYLRGWDPRCKAPASQTKVVFVCDRRRLPPSTSNERIQRTTSQGTGCKSVLAKELLDPFTDCHSGNFLTTSCFQIASITSRVIKSSLERPCSAAVARAITVASRVEARVETRRLHGG